MASAGSDATSGKPSAPRVNSHDASRSRKASDSLQMPKRAHTYHAEPAGQDDAPDAFETSQDADDNDDDTADQTRSSIDLDELPIELITLTDR